jgi:hypothetical protein
LVLIMPTLPEVDFQECDEWSTYSEAFFGEHPQRRLARVRIAASRAPRDSAIPR